MQNAISLQRAPYTKVYLGILWYTPGKGGIMAKVPVNAKIESQMKAKLALIGTKSSLSYADVVRMALYEYIGKFEKTNGKIAPGEINQVLLFDNARKAI